MIVIASCPGPFLVLRTTPLNPRKEGSGDLTYNELFQRPDLVASNQHQDLNLLLSKALLAVRAYIAGPACFAVVRDIFYNYCIPCEQLAVCKVTRPLFPWIEGCGVQD